LPLVIDASVVLAWYFEDEVSEYADRALDRVVAEGGLASAVWPLEIANGLLVAERRDRVSADEATHIASLAQDLPITIHEAAAAVALGPVMDLARSYNLSSYDASYLELAMREGLPLATQDERLRAAAGRLGVPIAE
jgi:predicted nucleic acid-binding protein